TAGQNAIDAVGLRQASAIPDVIVDGLRIGTTYEQLVVLPLTLTSFKGSLIDNNVKLNWTSTNEVNVKDFTIERSVNGRTFSSIGVVNALNRNEASYSFSDKEIVEGVNYYRLKVTDKDGSFYRSKILSLNNAKGIKAEIFPNPAVDNITIKHSKATTSATIKIVNANGQTVKALTVPVGAVQTSIAVDKLVRGNYTVVYQNAEEQSAAKFLKQ
ncbi:MAG TPA: T9SS type A sorting domain-containing protein, partial [Segetibacter sp.]